jgi:hypothetical protein
VRAQVLSFDSHTVGGVCVPLYTRSSLDETTIENGRELMRIAIVTAVAAIGLGFVGMSGASAAPASGTAIKDSAVESGLTQNVVDDHHQKHCYMRHGHRHCDL